MTDRARQIHEAGLKHLGETHGERTGVTWDFREPRIERHGLAVDLAKQAKEHKARAHDTVPGSDGDDGA